MTYKELRTLAGLLEGFGKINCLTRKLKIARIDDGEGIEATLHSHKAKWHDSCRLELLNCVVQRRWGEKHPETCQKCTWLSFAPRKEALLVKHISSVASLKVVDNPYVKKFGGCPYPTVCYKIGRQVATCQIECW